MKAIPRQYLFGMSIMTRTGDSGDTGLWSGERVGKDDLRIEAYGTVDELSAALGVARHACAQGEVLAAIEDIQRLLFRVGGELASLGKPFAAPILPADEALVAERAAELEARIPIKGFVVPGMTPGSAALDMARTIARRAERRVVALSRKETVSADLRKFLNRLSDYLYMLARAEEAAAGAIRFA